MNRVGDIHLYIREHVAESVASGGGSVLNQYVLDIFGDGGGEVDEAMSLRLDVLITNSGSACGYIICNTQYSIVSGTLAMVKDDDVSDAVNVPA